MTKENKTLDAPNNGSEDNQDLDAAQNGSATINQGLDDSPVKTGKKTKVRVLQDCLFGKCNEVVELFERDVRNAEEDGLVDSNPKAVAYAIKERKEAGNK